MMRRAPQKDFLLTLLMVGLLVLTIWVLSAGVVR